MQPRYAKPNAVSLDRRKLKAEILCTHLHRQVHYVQKNRAKGTAFPGSRSCRLELMRFELRPPSLHPFLARLGQAWPYDLAREPEGATAPAHVIVPFYGQQLDGHAQCDLAIYPDQARVLDFVCKLAVKKGCGFGKRLNR